MTTSKKEKLKVSCVTCNVDTIHKIVKAINDSGEAPMTYHPEDTYWWDSTYQIIQCQRASWRVGFYPD